MSRTLRIGGTVAAGLAAMASLGAVLVSSGTSADARSSLEQAIRLRSARIAVARAQDSVGGTDIADALRAARAANSAATRVGVITGRIVKLLGPTAANARAAIAEAGRGARTATIARKQTVLAARILGSVAGYQQNATRYATRTNAALRGILRALIRTNRSFPGP